ncbi:MAG TPA: hypothetical protein VEO74_17500, partial [Thermoanaerobaculia bacterium]|nr:hypothetical protein [Thermoanaerobaculia bacterium]
METSERQVAAGSGQRAGEGDQRLLVPIETTTRRFWIGAGALLAVGLWGAFAWYTQLRRGLNVTGLNVPVYWGLYITN